MINVKSPPKLVNGEKKKSEQIRVLSIKSIPLLSPDVPRKIKIGRKSFNDLTPRHLLSKNKSKKPNMNSNS